MKRRKHHSTSSAGASEPRRGRPSKEGQQRLSELDREHVAQEFRLRPLGTPVDVQFAPYYQRILKGDFSAIGDYVDRNAARKDLDPSFYELIGRLVTIRFYDAADRVLSDIERRGNIGFPTNKDVQKHWYEKLLPLCKRARQFISGTSRPDSDENREALWHDYLLQQRVAGNGLREWEKSYTRDSVRSHLSDLGCRGKELERLAEGNFQLKNVQEFGRFGLVPREIFFALLSTRRQSVGRPFVSTPAGIARKYACRIARISEGTVSHKAVRKIVD